VVAADVKVSQRVQSTNLRRECLDLITTHVLERGMREERMTWLNSNQTTTTNKGVKTGKSTWWF
jgi:hypothetical protein